MATFKAEVYEHQKKKDGTYNIKIRIIHNKKKRYLATPYYVTKEDLTRAFKLKNQKYIDLTDDIIRQYRNMCDKVGMSIKEWSVDQVADYISMPPAEDFYLDIVEYTRAYIRKLESEGKKGTAGIYSCALNNLIRFTGRERISIKEITVKFLNEWMTWIGENTKGGRAQSLYLTQMRAMHKRAKLEFNDEDAGIIRIPASPFDKVRLPKCAETRKRALSAEAIKKISLLPYHKPRQGKSRFNFAKDLFLLSFGLMGMNAVDLYNCTCCKGGRITYQRTKTRTRRADKAEMSVKIQPEIAALVEKYRDKSGARVFRFYKDYSTSGTLNAALNKGLKIIGRELDIEDLEFYAARHSWATIAVNDAEVDKYVVHKALDHVDEATKVTDIYIKKSWKPIDEANRKVLDFVNFGEIDLEEPK